LHHHLPRIAPVHGRGSHRTRGLSFTHTAVPRRHAKQQLRLLLSVDVMRPIAEIARRNPRTTAGRWGSDDAVDRLSHANRAGGG